MEERYESKLGTKEYWDNFYQVEQRNYMQNENDIGEVWFGEKVQNKILDYIVTNQKDKNISIIDIGCGNSEFLFSLYDNNYNNLFGFDYSEESIRFIEKRLEKMGKQAFKIFVEDLSKTPSDKLLNETKFDLLHDKGTLDAFLLFKENSPDSYIEFLKQICKGNNMFIITSCNHTKDELLKFFLGKVKFITEIEHKKFNFGGQTGQDVTTLVLEIII